MKKFVAVVALSLCAAASAEPVWILHGAKPGGNSGRMNNALAGELEKNGYEVRHEFLTGCRGIEQWMSKNPTKPAVFDFQIIDDLIKDVEKSSSQACDVGLDKNSVLTISLKSSLKFCAKDEATIERWINKQGSAKIGYHRVGPPTQIMYEGVAREINPSSEFVHIKGGARLAQALVSGDVDIAAAGFTATLEQAGAKCYVETDLLGTRNTKYGVSQLVPGTRWPHAGQISVWVGKNVPTVEFRKHAVSAAKNHPDIAKGVKLGAQRDGVAMGKTPDQQWRIITEYQTQFRK